MLGPGFFLSIVAAMLFGITTAIQKYRLNDMRGFSIAVLLKDRAWLSSILVGLAGILVYLGALTFASITVVQPMIAVSMLIPVLAGWIFFGESIGTKWIHIIFIIVGVMLLSA